MSEDTSKPKRKRGRDPSDASPKKQRVGVKPDGVARVAQMSQPRFAPPVIASTPGFQLADGVHFHAYSRPAPPKERRKNKKAEPAEPGDLLLHSTSHRALDYTAREDKPADSDAYLNHFVGIYDPNTRELNVVCAKKMIVRGQVRAQRAVEDAMAEQTARHDMMNLKAELGHAFGTKKAKKALLAITENAISPQKRPGDASGALGIITSHDIALMESIKSSALNIATKEHLQKMLDENRPIPKGDFEADSIQEVYTSANVVGLDILQAVPIADWLAKMKKKEAIQSQSRFVANRLNRVAANDNKVERLKLLRYLMCLLVVWRSMERGKERGVMSMAKRDKLRTMLEPVPDVVLDNIRRKFTDRGDIRTRNVQLMATHCCVLAAIIDNFETNMLDLREDLKLEQKQISQYYREVGARIKVNKADNKTEHIARFALPLEFPQVRQRRR